MCGIIAIVRKRTSRVAPDVEQLVGDINQALASFPDPATQGLDTALADTADALAGVDRSLRGEAGLAAMLANPEAVQSAADAITKIRERVADVEAYLEAQGDSLPALEAVNGALVKLKDALWAIERDRFRAAAEVTDLSLIHI